TKLRDLLQYVRFPVEIIRWEEEGALKERSKINVVENASPTGHLGGNPMHCKGVLSLAWGLMAAVLLACLAPHGVAEEKPGESQGPPKGSREAIKLLVAG